MKVYTTGQVAKICKVAPRTVSKWFDSGKLKGYRIPGSQDRRIPREQLITFLKEHGMPLGELEDTAQVVIVSDNEATVATLQSALSQQGLFKVAVASNGFEAGKHSTCSPGCIIVDFGLKEALGICNSISSSEQLSGTKVIALLPNDVVPDYDRSAVSETFRAPYEPEMLVSRVADLAAA